MVVFCPLIFYMEGLKAKEVGVYRDIRAALMLILAAVSGCGGAQIVPDSPVFDACEKLKAQALAEIGTPGEGIDYVVERGFVVPVAIKCSSCGEIGDTLAEARVRARGRALAEGFEPAKFVDAKASDGDREVTCSAAFHKGPSKEPSLK